ncbi:MAG: DUF58 domain-containing protein [Caulobacterales bacterium]
MTNARLDALALAADLPGVLLDAKKLAAAAPGVHGRRRAGQGEAFWQYRDHSAEDGARAVDWRRSARGERLYVKEREREAAQTSWFWIDGDPGMDWASSGQLPTKKYRALVLSFALSLLITRGGERVGALGQVTRAGPRALERLALDLRDHRFDAPPAPSTRSVVIYASDFYAPIELWRDRLAAAASVGASGALLMVADPAEEDFPFQGRTLFREPGGRHREALIGRAEAAKEIYAARLAQHRRDLRLMAGKFGFPALLHRTDHSPAPALAMLTATIAERYA